MMKREQVTVTLRSDILGRVDERIDGIRIRNRSHAIEVLLEKATSVGSIKKAFILAGGKGTRMRPFTYEIPKPMIPVKGKPLVQHIIELLRKHDIRDIILSTGYMSDKIKEHFGNGSKFGVSISYCEEKKEMGTAGALRLAKDMLDTPFLMFNGDVLSNIDLTDLVRMHNEKKAHATIALTQVDDPSTFGVAKMKGDKILEFIEKPKRGKEPSKLINAGVYAINPEIIKMIPKGHSIWKGMFSRNLQKKVNYMVITLTANGSTLAPTKPTRRS